MRSLIFIIAFLTINGCSSTPQKNIPREEVMKVIHNYSKRLKGEGIINRWYGVRCAGPDKIYDGKIHEISLGYSIDMNLQYREARSLFYRIVDNFLKEINSHERLKDQFFHYPVTYKDLHFSLCFDYQDKGLLKQNDIHQIAIEFNKIFYFIAAVNGATDQLIPNAIGPGIGTFSSTGEDRIRSISRKLPETEKQVNTVP